MPDESRRGLLAAVPALLLPGVSSTASEEPSRHSGPRVLTFLTRDAASRSAIPVEVELIRSEGYRAAGDGGGALYRRAAAAPNHALWFQSLDGAYWIWADVRLDVRMAGAIGDGVWDRGTSWAFSGSDDTQAIQNAIDAHCIFRIADAVWFPGKLFRITGPLHASYGTKHVSVRIFGAGLPHPAGESRPLILCDFSDAPGIVCQGAMGFTMRGMGLVGRNSGWIRRNDLGGSQPKLDDTIPSNWLDPALSPTAGSETAPYAGVAIDPYLGRQSHGRYRALSIPSYANGPIFAVSSDIAIEDCYIAGFAVGVVDQPGGFEGNGDFLKIRRCFFQSNQYGISIGTRESRNVLRDSTNFVRHYCVETTNTHGAKSGKMHGISINCAVDAVINIFKFGPMHSGPVVYKSMYAEGLWRLGDIYPDRVAETGLSFEDCQFSMNGQQITGRRGVPATVLGGFSPDSPVSIHFRNTSFFGYPSVLPIFFDSQSVSADGLYCRSNNGAVPDGNFRGVGFRSNLYQRFASNSTADGLILQDGTSRTGKMRLKYMQYDLDAARPDWGNVAARIEGPRQLSSSRRRCACTYMQRLVEENCPNEEGVWLPITANLLEKNKLHIDILKDKTIAFRLPDDWRSSSSLALRGPLAGDVLVDQQSGSVFFVREQKIQTGQVVAELQNNYFSMNHGVSFEQRILFDREAGWLVVINSRFYLPSPPVLGDLDKGDNVLRLAENHKPRFVGLVAEDHLYVEGGQRSPFSAEGARVLSVGNRGITFNAGALNTATNQKFGPFVRPGPQDN